MNFVSELIVSQKTFKVNQKWKNISTDWNKSNFRMEFQISDHCASLLKLPAGLHTARLL